jgi:hypothetical protein
MGLLYNSVIMQQEMKRNFIIDKLRVMNFTKNRQGKLIEDMDYDELKYEYVLASFREIDVENDSAKWFR